MHSFNQQFNNFGITLCSQNIANSSECFQGVSAIACTLKLTLVLMGVCCLFTHTKLRDAPHTALLNNIWLVLHNQTWHTRHVIVVHMKLSELYSVYSTSRPCLHFFLCNPYRPYAHDVRARDVIT